MKSIFITKNLLTLLLGVLMVSCVHQKSEDKLRVGTPGDYPPLTMYDSITGQFSGKDIELIKQFGKDTGKKIIFVKTEWKDLTKDMESDKFDIALGGISVNEKRKQLFNFSSPLITDRKVAVFRKEDSLKFTDFKNIDQKGIVIVENIGGTNEVFAKKNIQHSSLILVPDNLETFGLIMNHKADLMFTDETEAKYRSKIHPKLSYSYIDEKISPVFYKAIMIHKKDNLLLKQINDWLEKKKSFYQTNE